LLNLTMKVTGTSYRQVLRTMARTLIPVLLITAAAYYLIGLGFSTGENGYLIQHYQESILDEFMISQLLLLLPLGVVLLPLKGIKTVPTILIGLVGGIILTLTLQGTGLLATLDFIFWGYKASSHSPELNSILVSGGVWGMIEVVLIVVPPPELWGWNLMAYSLKPGRKFQQRVTLVPSEPGLYRVTKEFSMKDWSEPEKHKVSAEFTVGK